MRLNCIDVKPIFFLSLILASCTWARQANHSALSENEGNSILFLVFKIQKDARQSSIELLSKSQSTGKVKQPAPRQPITNHFLTIGVYRKNRLVHTLTIEHPLYKHVEYVHENGVLASKNVELNEAEFFIRLPVNADAIQISETISPGAEKPLTKIKL